MLGLRNLNPHVFPHYTRNIALTLLSFEDYQTEYLINVVLYHGSYQIDKDKYTKLSSIPQNVDIE